MKTYKLVDDHPCQAAKGVEVALVGVEHTRHGKFTTGIRVACADKGKGMFGDISPLQVCKLRRGELHLTMSNLGEIPEEVRQTLLREGKAQCPGYTLTLVK